MRAIVLRKYGTPAQMSVEDVPPPPLGPGQVRIRVHAVGVGFPDALQVAGKYQFKPPTPFTPGNEIAGVVIERASDARTVQLGDRVLVLTEGGGLAEECVVPAADVIQLPPTMTIAAAAGFLVNYGTAYHALVQRAKIKAGDSLLVLGAAGGVGLAAVEIGRALGARVLAAASTDEKVEFARSRGAVEAFNYSSVAIREKIAEFTEARGMDVVFDPVGAAYAEQAVRSMAWNGRYLIIGFAGGSIPAMPLNLPLLKGCSLVGVFWGSHTRREPAVHMANLHELLELYERGAITPHVLELDGLGSFHQALEILDTRKAIGKVVIRVTARPE